MWRTTLVLALMAGVGHARRMTEGDTTALDTETTAAHHPRDLDGSQKPLAALILAMLDPSVGWHGAMHSHIGKHASPRSANLHSKSVGPRTSPVQSNLFTDIMDEMDDGKLTAQKPYEKPLMPSLVLEAPATYQLKEKMMSFSGEDFSVTDLMGEEVIKVEGANVNLGGVVIDKLFFKDKTGARMFSVERRMLAASTCYDIYSADGSTLIAKIEREWLMALTPKYQFYYEGDDNPFGDFFAEGSFSDRKYTFKTPGGAENIAKVSRAPEVVRDVDTYAVNVAPGVDAAAIIAMAVIIDEDHDEEDAKKQKEEGGGFPFR